MGQRREGYGFEKNRLIHEHETGEARLADQRGDENKQARQEKSPLDLCE